MVKLPFFQLFRTRLSLLVLLLGLPAFALILWSHLTQRRIQASAIRDSIRSLSAVVAANQEDVIKNARQLLGTLTQFPFLVLATNRPFSELHLSNLLKLSPDYVNFGIIETNGSLFCSGVTTNVAVDLGDRHYFRRTIRTGRFSVGDFQIGRLTAVPSLNFGYPVQDSEGRLVRVLFASLRLSKLSESISHIQLPQDGTVLLTDRNGRILGFEPGLQNWVGKPIGETDLGRRIISGRESVFAMPGLDRVPRLHAVTPIHDGVSECLFVCVSVPVAVSMAEANRAFIVNATILGVVTLALLVTAWLYSRRFFLRPVNSLVTAAKALAQGELQARVGPISGAAELVQLGAVLDEMAHRLEERQAQLLEANKELRAEISERTRAEQRLQAQAEAQQTLEQQLLRAQRMETLGSLAGGIAHDLNNALAPILMSSELLRENPGETEENLKWLDLIRSSAERCTGMVKQIVSFARGSRGQVDMVHLVPVPEVIKQMVQIVQDTFPKAISIQAVVEPGVQNIPGDATELHQVLLNLCVNARDAMPLGGHLTLSAQSATLSREQLQKHPHAISERYLLLSVSDNGVGMSTETMQRIFEPFFTTKPPDKGTGLGLSTVAQIIKKHNGFIEVKSELGKGTRFDIYLPASQSRLVEAPRAAAADLPTGNGELILVVDDELFVLQLAKTTLESYGYRIITAENGLDAIASVEVHKNELRLLLTDTDMPFMDGFETVNAVSALLPSLAIIMTSGIQLDSERAKGTLPPHVIRLSKPYTVRQLLTTVAKALPRREGA